MKEGFGHSLDLFIVMMINLSTVVKHIANIRNGETKTVNGLGSLLIRAIPEAAHRVLKVLAYGICI